MSCSTRARWRSLRTPTPPDPPRDSRPSSTRTTPIRARPPADAAALHLPDELRHRPPSPAATSPRRAISDGEDCGPNINGSPVYLVRRRPRLRARLSDGRAATTSRRSATTPRPTTSTRRRSPSRPCARSRGCRAGSARSRPTATRDGILWVSYPLGDGQWQNVPGRLAAFDAATLRELWHDDGGYLFAKFTPPTIAGGRVVRATLSGKVVVYGLRPDAAAAIAAGARRSIAWRQAFRARPRRRPRRSGAPRSTTGTSWRAARAAFWEGRCSTPGRFRTPPAAGTGTFRASSSDRCRRPSPRVIARRRPSPAPGRHPWLGLGTPFGSSIYWSRCDRRPHRDRRDPRRLALPRRPGRAARLSDRRRGARARRRPRLSVRGRDDHLVGRVGRGRSSTRRHTKNKEEPDRGASRARRRPDTQLPMGTSLRPRSPFFWPRAFSCVFAGRLRRRQTEVQRHRRGGHDRFGRLAVAGNSGSGGSGATGSGGSSATGSGGSGGTDGGAPTGPASRRSPAARSRAGPTAGRSATAARAARSSAAPARPATPAPTGSASAARAVRRSPAATTAAASATAAGGR